MFHINIPDVFSIQRMVVYCGGRYGIEVKLEVQSTSKHLSQSRQLGPLKINYQRIEVITENRELSQDNNSNISFN